MRRRYFSARFRVSNMGLTMKKSRKIWVGVGAFILAGSSASSLPATPLPTAAQNDSSVTSVPGLRDLSVAGGFSYWQHLAQAATTGAGGEAGEGGEGGGEGGEAGINVESAAKDPVEYGVALQVIAAHYHAGLAAYEGKEQEAGAQMFAHGLSEVYFEMEDVFKKLGVTDLGQKLEATVSAANEKKPAADIKRRVNAVLAALAAAEKVAPKSSASAQAVKAHVAAELIDRAAAQFSVVQKDSNLEAYLDGLGFAMAARDQARTVLPWLHKLDGKKEKAFRQALALTEQAFPGIKRPGKSKVTEADLLSAASAAKLAVSGLQ
ncbi:hypothetical protein [Pseudorhodoplanes sinuspersici]|nr:hypothetical protein [Pseudorhodoplanes sinuspersici]